MKKIIKMNSYEMNNSIALISVVQNESRFIKEWLNYHFTLGFSKAIIYDNLSKDRPCRMMYEDTSKEVTYISWHNYSSSLKDWNKIQCKAYKDATDKISGEIRWALFLDIDEFLVIKSEKGLEEALKPYNKYKAVGINWQLFGTSGIEEIPEGYSVCKTLTKKSLESAVPNRHIKVIVDPSAVKKIKNPHWFILKGRDKVVDEDGIPISGPQTEEVKCKHFQINHYWTRDLKFLREVKYPRMKKYNPDLKLEDLIKSCNRDMNVVEDREMIKIYDRLNLNIPEFK